jgi:hypothetical protein
MASVDISSVTDYTNKIFRIQQKLGRSGQFQLVHQFDSGINKPVDSYDGEVTKYRSRFPQRV